MTEGTKDQSTILEWAKLVSVPEEREDDLDIYGKPRKDHNSMANMYKPILDATLDTQKFGSIYYLLAGLTTMNTILRHTLLPKSRDHRMIRAHSITLLGKSLAAARVLGLSVARAGALLMRRYS